MMSESALSEKLRHSYEQSLAEEGTPYADAVTDLTELRDYIADILLVPEIALRYVRSIRETINKLEYMASDACKNGEMMCRLL